MSFETCRRLVQSNKVLVENFKRKKNNTRHHRLGSSLQVSFAGKGIDKIGCRRSDYYDSLVEAFRIASGYVESE